MEHDGMCYDRGYVCTWNLNRRDFKPDTPTLTIEANVYLFLLIFKSFQGCIMCVEFHPTRPSILAGGSFNGNFFLFNLTWIGEIFLWDISQQDENLLFYSRIDDYYHREAIAQLFWFEQKLPGVAKSTYVNKKIKWTQLVRISWVFLQTVKPLSGIQKIN